MLFTSSRMDPKCLTSPQRSVVRFAPSHRRIRGRLCIGFHPTAAVAVSFGGRPSQRFGRCSCDHPTIDDPHPLACLRPSVAQTGNTRTATPPPASHREDIRCGEDVRCGDRIFSPVLFFFHRPWAHRSHQPTAVEGGAAQRSHGDRCSAHGRPTRFSRPPMVFNALFIPGAYQESEK